MWTEQLVRLRELLRRGFSGIRGTMLIVPVCGAAAPPDLSSELAVFEFPPGFLLTLIVMVRVLN